MPEWTFKRLAWKKSSKNTMFGEVCEYDWHYLYKQACRVVYSIKRIRGISQV